MATLALAGTAGGAGATMVMGSRVAHADPSSELVVLLPPRGIVFRSASGQLIARLSSDARGGVFELFDANGNPTSQLRPAPSHPGGEAAAPPLLPLVRSINDPGY